MAPNAGKATPPGKPPKITGHTPTVPRDELALSRKPLGYFQLTPPTLLEPRPRSFSLFASGEQPRLSLSPSLVRLFQEQPYPGLSWPTHIGYDVIPPDKTFLSIEKSMDMFNSSKGDDDDDNDKVHVGVDEQLDPGTFTVSLVLRNLNAASISSGNFGLDLLHEPTLSGSFTFNPPGSFLFPDNTQYGPVAAGVSMTFLNLHFKRKGKEFIELGLGQMGAQIDSTGKVVFPFGAQVEIHNPFTSFISKDLSVIISAGGSFKKPDPTDPDFNNQNKDNFLLRWSPIGISTIVHFD